MNIVFYNRDFSNRIPTGFEYKVDRYSIAMMGGPDKATIKIKGDADRWELFKLLRCPIEIWGDDGGCKWWGYVDRITIPHGINRVGKGLDEMYNAVTTKHLTGTLTASVDAQSVAEYGRKEFLINLANAPEADAAIYQAIYLEKHKQPVQELELSGGNDDIVMECYGWWQTLSWCYYSNASVSPIENVTQIRDIIASCGQFIEGVIVNGLGIPIEWTNGDVLEWSNGETIDWDAGGEASGLTSTPTRDGTNTALAYITELLNAGSVNIRPMLAYVDKNRWLHVYERIAETTEYIMRNDGDLETLLGRIVEPENCLAAVWVGMKGAPPKAIDPFFIERAEWVNGKVHYTSAGAFAQTRLDRYLQRNTTTIGGVPYVPPTVGYGGPPSDDTTIDGTSIAISTETTLGPIYSTNFDATDPAAVEWQKWETGLTAARYQTIDQIMPTPSGAIYAANFASGADTFVARASAPGAPFVVILDYAAISALYGGSSDNIRVCAMGQDKSALEFVAIAVSQAGENVKFFTTTDGITFTQATAFVTVNTNNGADLSFGESHWMFTAGGYVITFNAALSATTGNVPRGPFYMTRHRRVGATGITYHWDDDGDTSGLGIARGEDNGANFFNNISDNLDSNRLYQDRVVCDDVAGINLMARNGDADPVRSFNGGYTWSVMASLLPAHSSWYFDVAPGSMTQWGAAGGGKVKTTDDFGVTWVDRTGNLTDLIASPVLTSFKFYSL